jgi:2-polyprenyl-6-methoxyphenol hydroxylase-like FAD-dependent oxidoreductase
MPHRRTRVLVIGGGPVGLSTALHLDAQGIDCVVVEKHPSTATHPKASYFNVRTMEVLRQLGVADDVYATAMMPEGVSFYTKICGYKLGVLGMTDYLDHVERVLASTASPGCVSSQIVLEAILKEHAERAPHVSVLFHHEKIAIEQDDVSVRATLLNRASGERFVIEADYAIACEGVRSSTREELGRRLVGPPPFGHCINIYLEADLQSLVSERNQALFWISTPDATGGFIALGGDQRKYCFNTPYFPEKGERPEDFTEERCLAKVRAAIGSQDLPIKILAVGPWVLCGQVIDEYRQGRIFFAGDTAHLNIPTGGFGFNTGMQETHNLAWKIAAVLRGDAPDALLDTYHQERRPIAVFNVEKSRENAINIRDTGATFGGYVPDNDEIDLDTAKGRRQRAEKSAAIAKQKTHFLFLGQEIGYGYWDSPLVVPDGSRHYAEENAIEDPVYIYVPNARPGARAPHCWVARADKPDERIAIHDLFGKEFVLLTHGLRSTAWATDVALPVGRTGVSHYRVGAPRSDANLIDLDGTWARFYGIDSEGAVLVRPDGHVSWRARGTPDQHVGIGVREALEIALGRRSKQPEVHAA